VALIAGAGVAFVLFIVSAVGDIAGTTKYGRLLVPGTKTFDFPAGGVGVYYEERISLGENDNLIVQPVQFRIRPEQGDRKVEVSQDVPNNEYGDNYGTRRTVAELTIPEAGRYVVTSPTSLPQKEDPALAFGEPDEGFLDLDLKTPGLALLAGFALAAILFLVTFLRRHGEDERPGGINSQGGAS
jgi:hypothetical protein